MDEAVGARRRGPAAPVRRLINHAHPLFYFSAHRGTDLMDKTWDALSPAARSCAAFLARGDRGLLAHAASRGIPMIVTADLGGRMDEGLLRDFPNVLGVCGPEYPERFGSAGLPRAVEGMAATGGIGFWQFLFNFGRLFDGDAATYSLYRSHRERIVLEIKANGFPEWWDLREDGAERFGRFVHYQEVMVGAWLTGLAGAWGYHPEDWQWFEFGYYPRLFDYSVPGTRFRGEVPDRGMYNTWFHNIGYCGYPENLMAQQVLLAAIHGCAVLSFEHGWVRDARGRCPLNAYALMPMLDEVARRRLVPPREEVLERTRAAVWTGEAMGPELNRRGPLWPNSFRRLYATTSLVLQSSGRYGLVPCLPRFTPPAERKKFECFPSGYRYTYLPFLNALYPEEGKGRCFIARQGRRWVVINPYENVDREADFALPLYTNTCRRLSGRLGVHGLALVEERPDRIEVYLSNFRRNKDEFWDRRHEVLMGDGFADTDGHLSPGLTQAEAARAGREAREEVWARMCARPVMDDARTTRLVLDGHAGPDAPALEFHGHPGAEHTPRWLAEEGRYELDVRHNGVVRLEIGASGAEADTRPPEGLSRNLALDRPAKASAARPDGPPQAALDGLTETAWQPDGAGPHWLAVDLGQKVRPSACKVMGEAGGDKPVALAIEIADGQTGPWAKVGEVRVRREFFRVFAVDVEGGRRWVRLSAEGAPAGFRLQEFGIYAGPNAELKRWEPLVEPRSLQDLVGLFAEATADAERSAIEEAVTDFCAGRDDRAACVECLAGILGGADAPTSASLVRLLGQFGGREALAAVRRAAADPRGEVSRAAQWALAAWPDAAPLADVAEIARTARDLSLRARALRWLLPVLAGGHVPVEHRDRLLAEGLRLATEGADKLAYLEAIRKAACPEALQAALARLDDPDRGPWLVTAARGACLEIARRLEKSDPDLAARAIAKAHGEAAGAGVVPARLLAGPAEAPKARPSAPGLRWTAYGAEPAGPHATGGEEAAPMARGTAATVGLPRGLRCRRASGLWVRFDGFLEAPAKGEYVLALRSDRPAVLTLGGRQVLASESGLDGVAEVSLDAGFHAITLVYERGPLGVLSLRWLPPGGGDAKALLERVRAAGAAGVPFSEAVNTMAGVPAEVLRHTPAAD